jgi:toxin ParE1/3/4
LAAFPGRGSPRPDLADGVRTTAFQRRVIIAYRADENAVTILRVDSGARDIDRMFEED